MTQRYFDANVEYVRWIGSDPRSTGTFVYEEKPTSIFWPPKKVPKVVEDRQAHFVGQLESLRTFFGECIPIHIRWRSGVGNQMDKGCIGHAFGPGLPIQSLGVSLDGEITHVILWKKNAKNN